MATHHSFPRLSDDAFSTPETRFTVRKYTKKGQKNLEPLLQPFKSEELEFFSKIFVVYILTFIPMCPFE